MYEYNILQFIQTSVEVTSGCGNASEGVGSIFTTLAFIDESAMTTGREVSMRVSSAIGFIGGTGSESAGIVSYKSTSQSTDYDKRELI